MGILPGILFQVAGCVFVSETLEPSQARTIRSVMEESRKSAAPSDSLETGIRAFQEGDFSRAVEIFSYLSQTLPSEEGKRKALYGLACSRLAMAKDKNSLQEAMVLWEQWQGRLGEELGNEDPRMLTEVIKKMVNWAPSGEFKAKRPSSSSISTSKPASPKEEEMRQKDEEIRIRDEEIERLREQLEALENIHRAIERKKKGASSP
ncbi:MAG: hypothetical protein WHX93_15885 [bacterium]